MSEDVCELCDKSATFLDRKTDSSRILLRFMFYAVRNAFRCEGSSCIPARRFAMRLALVEDLLEKSEKTYAEDPEDLH